MATYTSTGTGGNWSASGTWTTTPPSGGPGAGDVAIIASGATVVVDSSAGPSANGQVIVGSNSSAVGAAVTINATNATTYGTLQVASGCTLQLRGDDQTTNVLMKVNQYALFQPLTGSTVLGDCASDYQSVIINLGRFEPQSGVTFSIPSANYNWAVKVNSEVKSPSVYDTGLHIAVVSFANGQVAGTGQTGVGSYGNFPTGQSSGGNQGIYASSGFSTAPSTEVSVTFPATPAQLAAAVNAGGKYAVDYEAGTIYLYTTSFSGLSLSYNYYHLDRTTANWRGWGIISGGITGSGSAGNTCLVSGCTFQYMGASGSIYHPLVNGSTVYIQAPVNLLNHESATAAGSSNRLAYVKLSTFHYCIRYCLFNHCTGASGDTVLFQGNSCYDASGGNIWDGVSFYGDNQGSSYVQVDSNTISHRGTFVDLTNVAANISYLSITNNTGASAAYFVSALATGGARTPFTGQNEPDASYQAHPSTPNLYIGSNATRGFGECGIDGRHYAVSGTSGNTAIVELNTADHCHRIGGTVGAYVTYRRNIFGMTYHHGITGALLDDLYNTDITYQNNLFYCDRGTTAGGSQSTSAALQLGYNHRGVLNNVVISGNTCDGWLYGLLDYSDVPDATGTTSSFNVAVVDNIIANGAYAFTSYSATGQVMATHCLERDFNVLYNQATAMASTGTNGLTNGTVSTDFYQSGSKYNRLTSGNRKIPGVALFDPSYTTAQSGQSLVHTVTTLGQNQTLAWGGGTAQQLIYDYGTSAGGGLRTLACSSTQTTWNSSNTTIRHKLLWVISGTGSGQVRSISLATANACYAATVSAGGSGYTLGQYLQVTTGTYDLGSSTGYFPTFKITGVSGGAVTSVQVISGGTCTTPASNPVATTRLTGSAGSGCTLTMSWAPGLLLVPDLTTALDGTSVFAVVNSYVQLPDSGSGTVHAGLSLCDVGSFGTAVFPTTTQTDSGISVVVSNSPTTTPSWVGASSSPTGVPTDYKTKPGGSGIDAGTADNAPSADYFGATRPQGTADDIGFFEFIFETVGVASETGGLAVASP